MSIIQGTPNNDTLYGKAEDNTITGVGGNDELYGQSGNDSLDGGQGADSLYGASGQDTLRGGEGDDSLEGGWGTNLVYGDAGNDVLIGGMSTTDASSVYGGAGNDTLSRGLLQMGGSGDDTLVWDYGQATLIGGGGNDTHKFYIPGYFYPGPPDANLNFTIDAAADAAQPQVERDVFEFYQSEADDWRLSRDGADLLMSNRNIAQVIRVLGNFYTNTATGKVESAIDEMTFKPYSGVLGVTTAADILQQVSADPTAFGEGNDRVMGDRGDDTLRGGAGNDVLKGFAGNDVLMGGTGNDTLAGGGGSDRYYVDSVGDVVVETSSDHYTLSNVVDVVHTNLENYTLPEYVSNLVMGGKQGASPDEQVFLAGKSGVRHGVGNDLGNVMNGGEGAELFEGGNGLDTLWGGGGNDTLVGGYLDGQGERALVDELRGGLGDDTYVLKADIRAELNPSGSVKVFQYFDAVQEGEGEGVDTVETDIQGYVAATNVENVITTAQSASGNELNNSLRGDGFATRLLGAGGDDTLDGGGGDDVYQGGAGADLLLASDTSSDDTFVWGRGDGADVLRDAGGVDRLDIGVGVKAEQLWFARQGDDLKISLIGTTDSFTAEGWYQGPVRRVEFITLADGRALSGAAVQTLVDAMASLTPPPLGQIELTPQAQALLAPAFKQAWLLGLDLTSVQPVVAPRVGTSIQAVFTDLGLGSIGNDFLAGSTQAVTLYGFTGADTLAGTEWADTLWGGTEADFLCGASGDDVLNGEQGDDSLSGGFGSDLLLGGFGNDTLWASQINQYDLPGSADTLRGGDGNDELHDGYDGGGVLDGGAGSDKYHGAFGGEGTTYLFGAGSGRDTLVSGSGTIRLGAGISAKDVQVILTPSYSNTAYDPQALVSVALLLPNTLDRFDVATPWKTGTSASYPRLDVQFSDGTLWTLADLLKPLEVGNGSANALAVLSSKGGAVSGAAGADTVWGGEGSDTLSGDDGNDILYGQGGGDLLSGGQGNDKLYGGTRNIYGVYEDAQDTLMGGDGDDQLFGDFGSDLLMGEAGNDTLYGQGFTSDTLIGGNGNDTYVVDYFLATDSDQTVIDASSPSGLSASEVETLQLTRVGLSDITLVRDGLDLLISNNLSAFESRLFVRVKGHFQASASSGQPLRTLDRIELRDGVVLGATQIESLTQPLVQSMAAFAPAAPGQSNIGPVGLAQPASVLVPS